jgi:hypothetical protein
MCLVLAGCAGDRAELARLERRYAEDETRIDGVALDLDRLGATQRQVVATYVAAKREWEYASDLYNEASSRHDVASRTYDRAAEDYAAAERYYRMAAMAMVTIAAGTLVCKTTMTTRQYRADLARKGMPMDRLEDVDHIFPRSRGGLDHPLNYQPLAASLNRSLGNKVVEKFMQAPLGFVTGMAVSALGVVGGCN